MRRLKTRYFARMLDLNSKGMYREDVSHVAFKRGLENRKKGKNDFEDIALFF